MSIKQTRVVLGDSEEDDYEDPQPKPKINPNTNQFKKPTSIPPPNPPFNKHNPAAPTLAKKNVNPPPNKEIPKNHAFEASIIKKVSEKSGYMFDFNSKEQKSKISEDSSSFEEVKNKPMSPVKSPMLNYEDSIDDGSKPFYNNGNSYTNNFNRKDQNSNKEHNNLITQSIQQMVIPATNSIAAKKIGKIKIVGQSQHKKDKQESPSTYKNEISPSMKNCNISDISYRSSQDNISQSIYDALSNNHSKNDSPKIKTNKLTSQLLIERQDWITEINNSRLNWKNSKNAPLQIKIMLKQLAAQASSNSVSQLQKKQPVSEPLALSSRFSQYPPQSEIRKWAKEFPVYRQIRGDGNCFYRAFNFSFLQAALTHKSSLYFLKFLSSIANPKKVNFETNYANKIITGNPNITPASMRAFVLHRLLVLYSYRVSLAENNDPKWEEKVINLLQQIFNEPPYCFDVFLVVAIKNYAIYELNQIQEFKAYEDMDQVKQQIMKYGFECELNQFPIRALSQGLEVCISLYQEMRGDFNFDSYGDKKKEKIILYYRPGHYDLVYPQKEVYSKVVNRR